MLQSAESDITESEGIATDAGSERLLKTRRISWAATNSSDANRPQGSDANLQQAKDKIRAAAAAVRHRLHVFTVVFKPSFS